MIVIHGTYHDNNFGDLLLMKIYERWILNTCKDDIVYPMVPKAQLKRFKQHFPHAHVGFDERKSWKALIYSGGGHFGEPDKIAKHAYSNSWNKRFFKRHVLPAELCIWTRLPYAIMGVGVGPLSNFFVRNEVKRILTYSKTTTVRDTISYQYAKNVLNIRRDVKTIPDAALSISKSDIPEEPLEKIKKLLAPYMGMSFLGIHHPRDFLVDTKQSKILQKSLLNGIKSSDNLLPVIFSDNGVSEYSKPCNDLCELIENQTGKSCLVVPFQGVWETIALISEMSAVLTTKLHVGIVAYALGVYCESFAIHSKVARFYEQINRSSQCSMLEDIDDEIGMCKISAALDAAYSRRSVMDKTWTMIKEKSSLSEKMVASFLHSVI